MNIPDEVIERAAHAILDAKYPGIAWGLIHGHSRDLKLQQATAAAQVIAEWARKETLREAAEVAKAWGRANEEGGYARSALTVARKIRALAEGGS